MDQLQKKLKEFQDVTISSFNGNVIGIYLHGSVAMKSFNSASSDIDILVVVGKLLTEGEKKSYLDKLVAFSKGLHLGKGLEMSMVLEKNVKNFVYPTPYEFHFGHDHLEKYENGIMDGGQNGPDPDLAAHFVITKARGICLYGKPIGNLFPNIPKEYYFKSIAQDAEWSFDNLSQGPNHGMGGVPPYAVLNYCRVLAFIEQGLITSKREGGEWGLENLPEKYKPLIQQALKEYAQSGSSQEVDLKLLKEFNIFAITQIRNEYKKFNKI